MSVSSSISPNIGVNTSSSGLRVELQNTFNRLDGQLSRYPIVFNGQYGPVGNAGAVETDLFSSSIETGTLSQGSSTLQVFISGNTAANGNNKTLKVYFGTSVVFTTGAVVLNNKDWTLQLNIVRTGGASQIAWGQFFANGNSPIVSVLTISENLTQNKTLKCTATGTTSADMNAYTWKVLLLN